MDFELEVSEQQKTIADQVMVYMELKIIQNKNEFKKKILYINILKKKKQTDNWWCNIYIPRLV